MMHGFKQTFISLLNSDLYSQPPHGLKGSIQSHTMIEPITITLIAVGLLCLALLTAGIIYLLHWLRRKKRDVVRPANHLFTSKWTHLRESIGLIKLPIDSGKPDEVLLSWQVFTSEISLNLRRVIELKTGLPLAERTNQEIFNLLKTNRLDLIEFTGHELMEVLTRLDEIRFAGATSNTSEAQALLNKLKDLVSSFEQTYRELERTHGGLTSNGKIFE